MGVRPPVNFNPRSHEGSDLGNLVHVLAITISIRAPTRGATAYNPDKVVEQLISIRAPTRGATKHMAFHDLRHLFQSALPRGERHVVFM